VKAALGEARGTTLSKEDLPFSHPFDLDAVDAVWVEADAWDEAATQLPERVRALEGFVRRGGLLLGPPPGESWPPGLAPRLGVAGRVRQPDEGEAAPLGLGKVVRPATPADGTRLLDAHGVREVATLLDGALGAPPVPGLPRHEAELAGRATAAGVLGLHLLALGLFPWLLRGRTQAAASLAASGAAAVLLLAALQEPEAALVRGAVLDVGGAGGRRVEAVWIHAGPGGFEEPVRFEGSGIVRHLGGRLVPGGALRLEPGRGAWVVCERRGEGLGAGDGERRASAWLMPLLVGRVDPKRMRFGSLPDLGVTVGGRRPPRVDTLVYPAP
jgi:hypothetical protein